jgi:hypothetical protein
MFEQTQDAPGNTGCHGVVVSDERDKVQRERQFILQNPFSLWTAAPV